MMWWLWIVIGVSLIIIDIFLINIFYLLWFGLAAGAVGVIAYLFSDISLTIQLSFFAVFVLLFLAMYKFGLQPYLLNRQRKVSSQEIMGQIGVVIKAVDGQGEVRLQRPVAGKDIWEFADSEDIKTGQVVKIAQLNGEKLKVVAAE